MLWQRQFPLLKGMLLLLFLIAATTVVNGFPSAATPRRSPQRRLFVTTHQELHKHHQEPEQRRREGRVTTIHPSSSSSSSRTCLLVLRYQSEKSSSSSSNDFESLRPETSFGSEAVPEAQRPINEYLDVTSQPLFDWANQENGDRGLLTRLGVLYMIVFTAVCYPISGATFTQDEYWVQQITAANVGATALVLVLMIRLYTGWDYIGQRLQSKVIEYEETGWYDGDWERKTDAELRRDRLVYQTNVKPVVERLQRFLAGTALITILSIGSFQVAMQNIPPLFDQYDPVVLERLQYDDQLAGTAAQNSRGKPAYCDSRYYRAVANGGQGCS